MHVIDVQNKKYWAQHRSLRNTQCDFDIEELEFLTETYWFLLHKPALAALTPALFVLTPALAVLTPTLAALTNVQNIQQQEN